MLCPLFREEKVAKIAVFDAVATKVEFVEGDYVLWEIVSNFLIDPEFTLNGLFGSSGSLICFGKKISVTALSF
jgi:hypothetical protein